MLQDMLSSALVGGLAEANMEELSLNILARYLQIFPSQLEHIAAVYLSIFHAGVQLFNVKLEFKHVQLSSRPEICPLCVCVCMMQPQPAQKTNTQH